MLLLPNRDHKKRAQDFSSPEAPLPRRPPAPADDLAQTLADHLDGVQARNLLGGVGDARPQLRRLEHLRIGTELEQLAKRLLQILEPDPEDTVAALQIPRQESQGEVARAQRHLHARTRRLERARPHFPVGAEIEVLRSVESLVPTAYGREARDAVDRHPGRA